MRDKNKEMHELLLSVLSESEIQEALYLLKYEPTSPALSKIMRLVRERAIANEAMKKH